MAIEMWDLAGADEAVRFSPYCWRIKMALAHKGLPATTHPWHFTDKDKIAFSGQGLVPVIRDGTKVVSDSMKIAAYLDEAYPGKPRLFEGPQALALSQLLHEWSIRSMNMTMLRAVLMDIHDAVPENDKPYFRQSREARFGGKRLEDLAQPADAAVAALGEVLAPVRAVLGRQRFIAGEAPAFADYIVLGPLMWSRSISPIEWLSPGDPVHAWYERMLDLYGGLARKAPRRSA